jgi:hypothetical protein
MWLSQVDENCSCLEPALGVVDGLIPHCRFGHDEDLEALASVNVLEVIISAPGAHDVLVITHDRCSVRPEHLLGRTHILATSDDHQLVGGGRNPLATTGNQGHGVIHWGPISGYTGGHDDGSDDF